MDVYSRKIGDRSIWYARVHFHRDGALHEQRISTRVTDDGTAASKRAAEANARELELSRALGNSRTSITSDTLKKALAKLVLKQELAQRSAGTLEIITDKAVKLFEAFGPDVQLHTLTSEALDKYAAEALRSRAVSTVYRELLVLRQAFKAAEVARPVFPDLGDMPPSRDRALEVEEQRALLRETVPTRTVCVRAYLRLGVRKSELWKITQVDWQQRYAFVNGTKTKQAKRWVPIPDDLFAEWSAAGRQLFEPWQSVDHTLKAACKRAGMEPCSVNDLRRTYATHMARNGCSPLLLAKYMGTSVKMLETVYARLEKRGAHDHEAVRRCLPDLGTQPAQPIVNLASARKV